MCYQVVEVYSACQCLYYKHAVDRCSLYPNHSITQRTILVGYACANHEVAYSYGNHSSAYDPKQQQQQQQQPSYSDSGYGSGRSHKRSHRSR